MTMLTARPRDEAQTCSLPDAYSGAGSAVAYFAGEQYPLHLHVIELRKGEALEIRGGALDQLAYVWRGAISAGGRHLGEGSSLIVEHGVSLGILGAAEASLVLAFSTAQPPAEPRAGGHVHLLPAERAPGRTRSAG